MLGDQILDKLSSQIKAAVTEADLTALWHKYLGREGIIKTQIKALAQLPLEEKRQQGPLWQQIQVQAQALFEARAAEIRATNEQAAWQAEAQSLGLVPVKLGHLHPITQTIRKLNELFIRLGYSIMEGPEIETDEFCFQRLNVPLDHPARDMQDTFYLGNKLLLRTQTSPMQIRVMEQMKPPIRMIAIGRCYRRDALDSSHSPQFHQIEGLVVDKGISLANLKATLAEFSRKMFGENTKVRFTPSYFPFVEPGAETSISCVICGGKGCPVCKYTGFLEMGGSGMVHPNVLQNVGIDKDIYQGFAFGWGVERIAMVKYSIPDIRYFLLDDMRFLEQF